MKDGDATIERVLAAARKRLRRFGAAGARLDADLLLAHVFGRDRGWLLTHGDRALDAARRRAFDEVIERRLSGEPVAYILGSAGFYGHLFTVSPDVLVPRPESEHVVEAAIADLRARLAHASRVRLCDVGTGSGALAIACALAVTAAEVVGTDASAAAIAIADGNAQRLGVAGRSRFFEGDLIAPALASGPFDVIVANLPYIPTRDVPAKPDPVGFEPALALDGGTDGLDLYRRLFTQLEGAAGTSCFFEAAPGTIEPLATLAELAFPSAFVEIGEDYAGLERFVSVTL